MHKLIIPGIMAIALAGTSTLALAQSQTQAGDTKGGQAQSAQSETNSNRDAQKNQAAVSAQARPVSAVEAEKWVGKRVYSQKDGDIGEIAAFKVGNDGNVEFFHADIGGFLGIGETSVKVNPDQLSTRGDKLYLDISKEEAMKLPRVEK